MIRNALFNGNNQYWLNSSGKPPVFVLEGFPNNLNEMTIFEEEICPIDHLNRFGPLGSTVDETQQLESHLYNKSKFLAIERATHNELNDLCQIRHNLAMAVGPQVLVSSQMAQLNTKDNFNCVSFAAMKLAMVEEEKNSSGNDDATVPDNKVWDRIKNQFNEASKAQITVIYDFFD